MEPAADPIASLLERFVPEGLVDRLRLLVGPGSGTTPGATPTLAERRDVTVLFADLSGFTALCERADPEEVVAILGRFLEVVVVAAARHGGAVDKFLGDAALVVFGAPRAVEGGPARAVAAALEIQEGVARLAAQLPGADVRATCAIERGEVVAGVIGGGGRLEYTVLGDAVNCAARLQKACAPGEVVVGEAAAEALGGAWGFVLEPLPLLPAKGKREPLRPFRVRRAGEAVEAEPGLVGRRPELAALDERLERLTAGAGGALVLLGCAGAGKSRLLCAAARRATARGLPVVTWPAAGEAPGAGVAALLAAAARAGPELAPVADRLPCLERDPLADRLPSLDPLALAAAIPVAARRLAGGSGPFVVLVDDLLRLDAASRAILAGAVPQLTAAGGLLLCAVTGEPGAVRDGLLGERAGLPGFAPAEALGVGPLPPFDAKQLLATLEPAWGGDHPLLERLARGAAGIPAALVALAAGRPSDPLVAVDALPPGGSELLVALAVLGAAPPETVLAVAGLPAAAAAILAAAEQAGLVERDEGRLSLRGELRASLLGRLVAAGRARLHTAAARALESAGEHAEAVHHRAGGTEELPAAEASLELAEAQLKLGRAEEACNRARAGALRARGSPALAGKLRIVEARALRALGHHHEATEALLAAASLGDDGERALAVLELARLFWERGRHELAEDCLGRARRLAGRSPALLPRIEKERGAIAFERGELCKARGAWRRAAVLFRRAGAGILEGRCRMNLGIVLNVEGRREQALGVYAACEPLLASDAEALALLAHNVAISLAELGRNEEALVALAAALAKAEELSEPRLAAMVLAHRARLEADLGRYDRAWIDAGAALAGFSRVGHLAGIGDAYKLLGVAAAGLGRRREAEAFLRRAVQELSRAGVKLGAAEALAELGRLCGGAAGRFRLEEAARLFQEVGAADRAAELQAELAGGRPERRGSAGTRALAVAGALPVRSAAAP